LFAQTRGLVTFQAVGFDLGRLSPAAALRAVFDRRTAYAAGKAALGITTVGVVAWLALRPLVAGLMQLGRLPVGRTLDAFGVAAGQLGLRIVLAVTAMAILDVVVTQRRHRRSLLMTHAEVRREQRDLEGDDAHRRRRRRAHREIGDQASLDRVRRADVVLVGQPTGAAAGLAIGLAYRPGGRSAPVVLIKGERGIAESIQRAAREAGLPVVVSTDPMLLRHLAAVAEGDEIPEGAYQGVAEVYARQRPARPG
jgi:flagellar biosynthesis protein FlhB